MFPLVAGVHVRGHEPRTQDVGLPYATQDTSAMQKQWGLEVLRPELAVHGRELRTLDCHTQLRILLAVQKQWGLEVLRLEFAPMSREYGRQRRIKTQSGSTHCQMALFLGVCDLAICNNGLPLYINGVFLKEMPA